jgi:YVTN family beta-propeller protein
MKNHRTSLALAVITTAVMAGPLSAQAAGPTYTQAAEIAIGGAASFDYLYVDAASKRLYVTHGTEVVVVDTATNTVAGRIAGTPGVHGAIVLPDGRVLVTIGRENMLGVVDPKTLAVATKIPTGANPDALLYEPSQKEVYVFNHTGRSATVLRADTLADVATIPLSGTAEFGQTDTSLGRVFVNIEDKSLIDAIDIKTHTVVASWPVAPAEEPTGLAIDVVAHRLFAAGGRSAVAIDATNGKVVGRAPICARTDATWYDAGLRHVLSACGDGHITVMQVGSSGELSVVETVTTAPGARTMAIDAASHRVYTAAGGPNGLRVLVFDWK